MTPRDLLLTVDLSVRLKTRTDNEFVEAFTDWPWTVWMRVLLPLAGCFVAFVMGKGAFEHAAQHTNKSDHIEFYQYRRPSRIEPTKTHHNGNGDFLK